MKKTIQTLRNGRWQNVEPRDGEKYRIKYSSGHTVTAIYQREQTDVSEPAQTSLTQIAITDVSDAKKVSSDKTKITAEKNTAFTISGALDIADKDFITPILKIDDNSGVSQTLYKDISVKDGKFSVALSLDVGKYKITADAMNAELGKQLFAMPDINVFVTL